MMTMITMMNLLTMMTIMIGPRSDKKDKSYFCAFPWNGFLAFIYWRSGFAPPSPLYVNSSPLFESQIERNISGTYFISINLLQRMNLRFPGKKQFFYFTRAKKFSLYNTTLGFTLRKSLPPQEMTSLWSFLQWLAPVQVLLFCGCLRTVINH